MEQNGKNNEMKIGNEVRDLPTKFVDRMSHGNESFNNRYRLMELDGNTYLLSMCHGTIETKEGMLYGLSNGNHFNSMSELFNYFNVDNNIIGDSDCDIYLAYEYLQNAYKINEDGSLGSVDVELINRLEKLKSFSMDTNDEYCVEQSQESDRYLEEDNEEWVTIDVGTIPTHEIDSKFVSKNYQPNNVIYGNTHEAGKHENVDSDEYKYDNYYTKYDDEYDTLFDGGQKENDIETSLEDDEYKEYVNDYFNGRINVEDDDEIFISTYGKVYCLGDMFKKTAINLNIEENNTDVKKVLVERALAQQQTIAEQQTEINKLNSQKKEL